MQQQRRAGAGTKIGRALAAVYYTGVSLSFLVGLWHFFVPRMFQWYSYIPAMYENLIVGINWTNLCFSFLLCGASLLLLLRGKSVLRGNADALLLYALVAAVWVFRVLLAVFNPWPLEPIAWAAYGQLIASVCIMLLVSVPFFILLRRARGGSLSQKEANHV